MPSTAPYITRAVTQVLVEPPPPPPPPQRLQGPLRAAALAAVLGIVVLVAALLRRAPGDPPQVAADLKQPGDEQGLAEVAELLSEDLDAVLQEQAADRPGVEPGTTEAAEEQAAGVTSAAVADVERAAAAGLPRDQAVPREGGGGQRMTLEQVKFQARRPCPPCLHGHLAWPGLGACWL